MRFSVVLLFLVLLSCTESKPRRPINKAQATSKKENYSISFNKAVNEHQEKIINAYVEKDSLLEYQNSNFGFVFAKLKTTKNSVEKITKNTQVTYQKTIYNLREKQIYPTQTETIVLGKSNEIKGIVEGLKLMKEEEEFKFIFTSFVGYGIYGDEKKIGGNTPLIVKIKLLNIKK